MARRKASRGTGRRLSSPSRIFKALNRPSGLGPGRRLRFEPLETRRLLAITVDTIDDVVDANDGLTSLREAIIAANAAAGADTIDFASSLTTGGPATIALAHNEFEVIETLSIDGPGAALLTIDAQQHSRVFTITSTAGDVTLAGLTLSNGYAEGNGGAIRSQTPGNVNIRGMQIVNNRADGHGGGIFSVGMLSIQESTIENNRASAIVGTGGGIIAMQGLEMRHSRVSGNSAGVGGGGAYIGPLATKLQIAESTFDHNEIMGRPFQRGGGGISVSLRTDVVATISNSVFRNNSASEGGGVRIHGGQCQFLDCLISNNTADTIGGGVLTGSTTLLIRCEVSENYAFVGGGGIRGSAVVHESTFANNRSDGSGGAIQGVDVELYDSTLSGNNARLDAGAIFASSSVTAIRSTIADNEAGRRGGGIYTETAAFESTIVAGNQATLGGPDIYQTSASPVGSVATFSLIGHADGTLLVETGPGTPDANGNLIGGHVNGAIDPMLAPLTYNGGYTLPGGALLRTHALMPGSPALNSGDSAAIAGVGDTPAYDQRGNPYTRVTLGRIDIGAYELQSSMQLQLVVDTQMDESDGDYSTGDLSLREAIQLANLSNFEGLVDTISFSPTVFAGPTTIQLTLGALVVTDTVEIAGFENSVVTIDASASDPTPGEDHGNGTNVFVIDDLNDESLIDVSIRGLTLQGGDAVYGGGILSSENLTITGGRITDNASQTLGGGIFSVGGTLTLADTLVAQNRAVQDGGGVASVKELVVTRSTISGNTAKSGGGIYSSAATTIERSQITGNMASAEQGQGGAILAVGPLTVFKSRVSGNSAFDGGGIWSDMSLEFNESTVSGNSAARNGGGIVGRGETHILRSNLLDNQAGGDGGGLFGREEVLVDSSTLARNRADGSGGGAWLEANDSAIKLLQATVSGNRAEGQGAGVWASNLDGSFAIAHSTIAYNESPDGDGGGIFAFQGELDLDHSIVALNTASAGPDITGFLSATIDARFSLIGDNLHSGLVEAPVGQADAKGNLIGGRIFGAIDPLLQRLLYRGGFTPTHSLATSPIRSPALDAGNPAAVAGENGVPEFDQRGMPFGRIERVAAATLRIDIGAFESGQNGSSPGDFGNYARSSFVDAADYTAWRNNLGKVVTPYTTADGNGDGEVDWADYEVWKWNFGQTLSLRGVASSLTVAEEVSVEGQAIVAAEILGPTTSNEVRPRVSNLSLPEMQPEEPAERNNRRASAAAYRKGTIGAADTLLLLSKLRGQNSKVAAELSFVQSAIESSRKAKESIDLAFAVLDGIPDSPR